MLRKGRIKVLADGTKAYEIWYINSTKKNKKVVHSSVLNSHCQEETRRVKAEMDKELVHEHADARQSLGPKRQKRFRRQSTGNSSLTESLLDELLRQAMDEEDRTVVSANGKEVGRQRLALDVGMEFSTDEYNRQNAQCRRSLMSAAASADVDGSYWHVHRRQGEQKRRASTSSIMRARMEQFNFHF